MTDCPNCGAQLPAGAVVCNRCGAAIPVLVERSAAPPQEGPDPTVAQVQRLLASYCKVERLLGRGRLTAVYKAEEIKPPRPVAIKMLPPGLGPAAAHFMDEARKATALNHPNILPIYRVGLRAGVPFFVAMKLVEGRSLASAIEAQGALPLSAVLVALRVAAEALTYAQGRGTAHGRLHAANILLDGNGHVVISDFGIGRVLEDAMPAAAGKAGPSGPEHGAGGPPDPRNDQYALGVVALQMLTGSMLPLADPLVSSHNIGSVREGTPDALLQVVQTVLAQDPAQRYASAADMLAALKAIPFSETDRRDGYTLLGQLARGEPVPKVPAPAPPRRFEARPTARAMPAPPDQAATVVRPAIGATPSAAATPPRVSAATPAPAASVPPRVSAPAPAPAAPTPPRVSAPAPAPAAPTPPRVSAPAPAPAVPTPPRVSVPTPAPVAPAAEPVAATRAVPAVPAAPAAPTPPRTSGATPKPGAPAARVTPSGHGMFSAARQEPKRRSRVVWVLVALVVIAGLGAAAYWALVIRPAARPMAQAPVTPHAPPSRPGTTPVAPERSLADTAHRASAADSAHAGTALAAKTGRLFLSVDPASAVILVDGRESGNAEGYVDSAVTAGRRHLEISAPGYVSVDRFITVRAGGSVDLGRIALRDSMAAAQAAPASSATGRLRLRAVPATAEISVDGQSAGVGTLIDFQVAAGQHQLRISAPGYVTLDTLISVDAGATVRLGQVVLKSTPGGP